MALTDVFLTLGEPGFGQLLRSVSMGKLKTYQLYDRFKTRTHVPKLNAEGLQKATPRLWARLSEKDEEFAQDISQAVLVSHLDMIVAVLTVHLHNGFFMNWSGQQKGEGYEFHLLAIAGLLVVLFKGAGALSIDHALSGRDR